jgi:hypothetical protein
MAVSARNYNRVIDLTLYTSDNKMVAIKCPEHGRKPAIEINGTFYDNGTLPAFNVTIKNLYLDIKDQNYTRLRVKAGYVDGTKNTFECHREFENFPGSNSLESSWNGWIKSLKEKYTDLPIS